MNHLRGYKREVVAASRLFPSVVPTIPHAQLYDRAAPPVIGILRFRFPGFWTQLLSRLKSEKAIAVIGSVRDNIIIFWYF
jgi:hypothetical protein